MTRAGLWCIPSPGSPRLAQRGESCPRSPQVPAGVVEGGGWEFCLFSPRAPRRFPREAVSRSSNKGRTHYGAVQTLAGSTGRLGTQVREPTPSSCGREGYCHCVRKRARGAFSCFPPLKSRADEGGAAGGCGPQEVSYFFFFFFWRNLNNRENVYKCLETDARETVNVTRDSETED